MLTPPPAKARGFLMTRKSFKDDKNHLINRGNYEPDRRTI